MSDDRKHGIVCMWTGIAGAGAVVGGLAMSILWLLSLGMTALAGAALDTRGLLYAVSVVVFGIIALVVRWPLVIVWYCLMAAVALCLIVLVPGLLWLLVAGTGRALSATGGVRRNGDGLRLAYLHWIGGWLDGWRATGNVDGPLTGIWKRLAPGASKKGETQAERDASMLRMGERAMIPMYFALRAPAIALLWGPRTLAAALLRGVVRARRRVRECRECHGWTKEISWRCPGCGRVHRVVEPSEKFGIFEWRCECGARMPTLGALGRRMLAGICAYCGGALTPVERRRGDVAFLGGEGVGTPRLWREAVAALSGSGVWRMEVASGTGGSVAALTSAGRRQHLRIYDTGGEMSMDSATLLRQRCWGHIGAVAFAVDPGHINAAEKTWETWRRVMGREHPGRVRRMACAVILTNTADGAGLPPEAGDKEWQAFWKRVGAGNLMNGLDSQFRTVKAFASDGAGKRKNETLWAWTAEQAFRSRRPRVVRNLGGGR